jgi:hypothetical protein
MQQSWTCPLCFGVFAAVHLQLDNNSIGETWASAFSACWVDSKACNMNSQREPSTAVNKLALPQHAAPSAAPRQDMRALYTRVPYVREGHAVCGMNEEGVSPRLLALKHAGAKWHSVQTLDSITA